jgi:hypothetical protein
MSADVVAQELNHRQLLESPKEGEHILAASIPSAMADVSIGTYRGQTVTLTMRQLTSAAINALIFSSGIRP